MAGKRLTFDVFVNRTALQRKLLRIVDNHETRVGVNSIVASMMKKYIPMKTGALRRSVRIGERRIEWPLIYARYQYYGRIPPFNYTTPGTGPFWDKVMLQRDKRAMQIRITNYLKRRARELSK